MGIKGLTGLLSEHAPNALKHHDIKTLFGRKVAIDASMSIYQFLIAVRQRDGEMLTNEAGETTSHLMGTFYRTIRLVENGIKPAYVFDGRPPELKRDVLSKRFQRREEAKGEGEEAKETGTVADVDRFSRRTVKVTKEHNEECQRLLRLMGIPVVVAPSEAEAQCAELARGGKVYAAGSEDMDTLTFAAPMLFRHLTFSEAKKQPISEINLQVALDGLNMTMSQFIELCILLGCDYLEPIKGIGPKSALKLMREHGSLKAVVKHLRAKAATKLATTTTIEAEESGSESEEDLPAVAATSDVENPESAASEDEEDEDEAQPGPSSKSKSKPKSSPKSNLKKTKGGKTTGTRGGIHVPAEDWPWQQAKELFEKPDVTPAAEIELEWKEPDIEGLIEFLVKEKGFNEERVRAGATKLSRSMSSKQQGRLDGFFVVRQKDKNKIPASPAKPTSTKGKAKSETQGNDLKGKGKGVKRKTEDPDKGATKSPKRVKKK